MHTQQVNYARAALEAYWRDVISHPIPTSTHLDDRRLQLDHQVLGDHGFAELQASRKKLFSYAQKMYVARHQQVAAPQGQVVGTTNADPTELALQRSGVMGDIQQSPRVYGGGVPGTALDLATGGRGHGSPLQQAFVVGSLLPFGRPVRAARAGLSAAGILSRGGGRELAGATARAVYRDPLAARTAKRIATTTWQLGGAQLVRRTAQSRTGRLIEENLNTARGYGLSKIPGVKTFPQRFFEEVHRREKDYARMIESDARTLEKIHLSDPQRYAIRIAAEGVDPKVRLEHHLAAAKAMKEIGHTQVALYHGMHASTISKAMKYIDVRNGQAFLSENAPVKLKTAYRLMRKSAGTRENLYRAVDALDSERIANRAISPARFFRGARYRQNEDILREVVNNDPTIRAADQEIDQLVASGQIEPIQGEGLKKVMRANMRVMATEHLDNPEMMQEVTGQLAFGAPLTNETLPPELRTLYQAMPFNEQRAATDAQGILNKYMPVAAVAHRHPIPPGAETPEALVQYMRGIYLSALKAEHAAPWYREAADTIMQIAQTKDEVLTEAKKIAQLVAIYSPRESVKINARKAIQAYLEYQKLGMITVPGPAIKNRKAKEVMELGAHEFNPKTAPKTWNFYGDMLRYIDPAEHARLFPNESVTIDTWMRRIFNYPQLAAKDPTLDAPGEPMTNHMYGFMADTVKAVARQMGWTPDEVQAAVWTYYKANHDTADILRVAGKYREKGYKPPQLYGATADGDMSNALQDAYVRGRTFYQADQMAGPEVTAGVQDTLSGSGGHTWTPNLKTDTGRTGFQAGIPGTERQIPVGEFSPDHVVEYRRALGDKLAAENARMGAWKNDETGMVYLDASHVYQDKAAALAQARKNGDLFIWDRANFAEIPTGLTQAEHDAIMARNAPHDPAAYEAAQKEWQDYATKVGEREVSGPFPNKQMYDKLKRLRDRVRELSPETTTLAQHGPEWEAFARDIRKTLPKEEWPDWVKESAPKRDRWTLPGAKRDAFGHPTAESIPDEFPPEWLAQGKEPQSLLYYRELVKGNPDYVKALGSNPSDMVPALHRVWQAAIEKGDQKTAKLIGDEASRLYQRGGAVPGVGNWGIKGSITFSGDPELTQALVRFSEHADATTFVHEVFGHFSPMFLSDSDKQALTHWAGGNFDITQGPIDRAAAEKVARGMEQFFLSHEAPVGLKPQFLSLQRAFQQAYDGADLPTLDRTVGRIFKGMFDVKPVRGGRWIGGEDVGPFSGFRVPYAHGRPIPHGITQTHRRVATYTRYLLSGGKVIGKGAEDKSLRRAFTGAGLESGYFKIDPTKAMIRDVVTAVRLTSVHRVRELMIEAGHDLPTDISDIAVKINPDENTPKAIQGMLDRMREVDSRGGKLAGKDLQGVDFELMRDAGADVFPAQIDGVQTAEYAAEMLNHQTPHPNIKWIPREWLDYSGLIPPTSTGAQMGKVMKAAHGLAQAGLIGLDALNDLQRLFILYLNPAYIPVNLMGNLVMNVMQQGVFTPVNLWRSALMHQWLPVEYRGFIDNMMGEGLTSALTHSRTTPGELMHATIGQWINVAVDRVPRRSAWLHAARQHGYTSKEAVHDLITRAREGDPSAMQDVHIITRVGQDAIVDYERLSPLERELVGRVIFFYPWVKGATHWSIRYGLDHPMQAAGLVALGEHAYMQQQKELGAMPYYTQWEVPINTESVGVGPFSAADVVGKHEWTVNRNGEQMPMTVGTRQLLTMSTPAELLQAGLAFATGDKNAQGLVENLTPAVYSLGVALYGYDPFRHKEVDRSIKSFLGQLQDVPQTQRFESITMPAGKRRTTNENRIFPRSREEAWWQLAGSSLAPKPYSRKVAAERLLSNLPTLARHRAEAFRDAKKFKGQVPPLTPEVLKEMEGYDSMQHDLKTGMKGSERLRVVAKYYKQQYPDKDVSWIDNIQTEGQSEQYAQELGKTLFPNWRAWDHYRQKAAETAAAAEHVKH